MSIPFTLLPQRLCDHRHTQASLPLSSSFLLTLPSLFPPSHLHRKPLSTYKSIITRASSSTNYVEDNTFRIEKISFGSILTPIGLGFLSYGFGAFFQLLPGSDISSLLLIYGFPITLLGFALSYAQLKPVPCLTTPAAFAARDAQSTDIQRQVREDVTRFRYGDEQHLDEALTRIFRFGQGGGLPRRLCPVLVGIREEMRAQAEGEQRYTLVLEFQTKKEQMTQAMWEERIDKFTSFFGPGVVASLEESEQGMDVVLVCDGSGAGRGGGEKADVLPPLMPGLKPRQQ
jgi:hypothetical protein